jgi:hypothetical protein
MLFGSEICQRRRILPVGVGARTASVWSRRVVVGVGGALSVPVLAEEGRGGAGIEEVWSSSRGGQVRSSSRGRSEGRWRGAPAQVWGWRK